MITAGVAVVAGVVAYFQVREARRTREAQAQPFVVVDIEPGEVWDNAMQLVIENVGRTLATDVKIRFTPPLETTLDDYDLTGSVLLREGIATMPPRRRVTALFDMSHDRIKADLPLRYDVQVHFKDARGWPQDALRYVVDLSYMSGLQNLRKYGMHDAAKALTEMQKSMKRWSDIRGRLKVWVRDEDARAEGERIEER